MIASCTDNWHSTPYECCCVLEDRFLLLGYHDAIQLLDLQHPEAKPKTIIQIRARSMVVIESCRAVLILAGRYKQVRCYSYDALLRLIYAVLSIDWSTRRDKFYDVPTQQAWEHIASQSGKAPEDENDTPPPLPIHDSSATTSSSTASPTAITTSTESVLNGSNGLSNIYGNNNGFGSTLKKGLGKKKEDKVSATSSSNSKQITLVDQLTLSGLTKAYCIGGEMILQNIYYKLPDSKDALGIQTYQTSTYVFAAIRHRDKIVLWQRKRDHPLRPFYRLKVFWIPAETKSIAFADDRSTLRHILAVFSTEATAIELRDSKVQTVPIDPVLERIYHTTWIREQYEHQLGSPRSPNSPIPSSSLPASIFTRYQQQQQQQQTEQQQQQQSSNSNSSSSSSNNYSHSNNSNSSVINDQISNSSNTNNINNSNASSSSSYPTLPASLSVPPIQWTSLFQLPFYPDTLPATTLTTEYSIPPSYSTVITSLPFSAPPDPVALPSAAAPQLFFATLSKQSYIIDLTGSLFSTQVYKWSETPTHIEFVQLDINVNDWYVVGFGSETVEIIHVKTAQTVQRVMHGVPVKFLGRWDGALSCSTKQENSNSNNRKKSKAIFKSLFWSCAANERIHVYMLKSEKIVEEAFRTKEAGSSTTIIPTPTTVEIPLLQ